MVKGLEIRRKKDYFDNFYRMGANATNTVSNGVAILTKSNITPQGFFKATNSIYPTKNGTYFFQNIARPDNLLHPMHCPR